MLAVMAASIVKHVSKTRVSSVLNRDIKQFGKQFLFDRYQETCWNSDQGSPQYIHLEFSTPVKISEIIIQFQGGFSGKECKIECTESEKKEISSLKMLNFYPEDINSLQRFPVDLAEPVKVLRIVFASSTDLFGRIVIYNLDILGYTV